MIKMNGKIIEATEEELRKFYKDCKYDEILGFEDFLKYCEECGVKAV